MDRHGGVRVGDQSELEGLSDLVARLELVVRLEGVDHLEAMDYLALAGDEEAEVPEALEAEQEDDQQQDPDCSEGEGAAEQSDRYDKAGQKLFPL